MNFSKWEKKSGRVKEGFLEPKASSRKCGPPSSLTRADVFSKYNILLALLAVNLLKCFNLKASSMDTHVPPLSAYSASSLGSSEFLWWGKCMGDSWYSTSVTLGTCAKVSGYFGSYLQGIYILLQDFERKGASTLTEGWKGIWHVRMWLKGPKAEFYLFYSLCEVH